jgi:hypothetical protein
MRLIESNLRKFGAFMPPEADKGDWAGFVAFLLMKVATQN